MGDILSNDSVSRRSFLRGSGAIAGSAAWPGSLTALAAIAQSACSARDDGSTFRVLSATEATELEAIAARIMPTTETAGAREAGVIHFMDQAFESVFPDMLATTRRGLAEFQAGIPGASPGARRFSDLDEADQDAYLEENEDTSFFDDARFLTLAGFFAMSKYGGNRDDAGWKLVGMDPHQRVSQPPFGYYDAEYMREEQDGE